MFAEIPLTYADLDQAIGRIHRFGQERECLVTMFVLAWDTAGDEKLLEALLHWRDISDIVLDGKEGGSTWNWTTSVENRPDPRFRTSSSDRRRCARTRHEQAQAPRLAGAAERFKGIGENSTREGSPHESSVPIYMAGWRSPCLHVARRCF